MMKRLTAVLLVLALLPLCCAAAADSELPSRYDMREDGIVTPVKLQYPWGCCWCFGAIAATETAILSAMGKTYEEYPLDLSELHTSLFAKLPVTAVEDPTQVGEGWYVDPDEPPKETAKTCWAAVPWMWPPACLLPEAVRWTKASGRITVRKRGRKPG